MATPVIMPRQGQSVESCIIAKWHKKKGEQVQAGELLFSYETDKASFDEEAKVSGTLLEVFFEEGDDVPCLKNVCVIGQPGESAEEFRPEESTGNVPEEEASGPQPDSTAAAPDKEAVLSPTAVSGGDAVRISPRAKNLALREGVDYRYAEASGPYGRIIERDIAALREAGHVMTPAAREESMSSREGSLPRGTGIGGRITTGDLETGAVEPEKAEPGPPQPLYEEVKLTNIRKVIARAMHHSITSTCQLTLDTSFDASDILSLRKKLKADRERLGLENITLNDIILYAVSRTLPEHRELNAHLLDDKMLYFTNVNLALAIDTARGLIVPVIYDANHKSLNEISGEAKKLARECQSGSINPDLTKNGSFTVTNLGTLDIESFTPVLNAPQTGILGVNSIVQRAREVDGEYEFYPAMGLSLTFDHRALDGAPAARFLQALKKNLESFSTMLAK